MDLPFLNNHQALSEFCKAYRIEYLALFGSFARGEPTEDSDVDLLVEFQTPVGFFELARIEEEMENQIGRKVDLVTRKGLSKHVEPYVRGELIQLYEKKS